MLEEPEAVSGVGVADTCFGRVERFRLPGVPVVRVAGAVVWAVVWLLGLCGRKPLIRS